MAQFEGSATAGPTLSIHKYWKNAISVCEAALSMLSVYEEQNLYLVDSVTVPLRQLIDKGRDFDALRNFRPPHPDALQPKNLRKTVRLDFDPRVNWTIEDPAKVLVQLSDNTVVTAHSITTAEQLDSILPEIRRSPCIALDCEFLGRRKRLPELKVLQIAVSTTLGYAVMIDQIGMATVRDKLKGILEDEELNRIGWAFRADAQAIEGAFHNVQLAPVLDLQAKLKATANEEMNLAHAMKRYAGDWKGLDEFQKAKQLGDTFQFLEGQCVWLQNPLPPEALVYSVFDVVSLVALWESTRNYETKQHFYWPNTLTSTLSPKALDRWYRDRMRSTANHQQNTITLVEPSKQSPSSSSPSLSQKGKERTLRPPPEFTPNEENNSDNDVAYQNELNWAMQLSLQEYERSNGTVPATSKRATSSASNASNVNTLSGPETQGTQTPEPEPPSSEDLTAKQAQPNQGGVHRWHQFRNNASRTVTKVVSMDYNKMNECDNYLTAPRAKTYSTDSQGSHSDNTEEAHHHQSWNEEAKARTQSKRGLNVSAPVWQTVSTPPAANLSSFSPEKPPSRTPTSAQTESWEGSTSSNMTLIPESNTTVTNIAVAKTPIYSQQLQANWYNDQVGSFEWQPDNWNDLVNSSMKQWQQGKDVQLTDYEKSVAAQPAQVQHNQNPIQFKTSVMPDINWKHEQDSWEKVEERPNTMQIPIKGVARATKYKPRGPKASNPDDYEMSSDDDEANDSESSEDDTAKGSLIDDTCVDNIYLNDHRVLHMHVINRPEQFQSLVTTTRDGSPLSVAIAFHFHTNGARILKALQLFLNTGDSYTILMDQACNADPNLMNTPLGFILQDSSVRRIGWCFDFVAQEVEAKVGFSVGRVLDLSRKLAKVEGQAEMPQMFTKYLSSWINLSLYQEAKAAFDAHNSRKFSGSIWDKTQLPDTALRFSTMQGAILYQLYLDTRHLSIPEDSACTWPEHG